MLKDLLSRKEETDRRWRESNLEIDCLKNQMFTKEDMFANLLREKEELDRQVKFLEIDNERLNVNLSECDGKRSISEDNLRKIESGMKMACADLEAEREENERLNKKLNNLKHVFLSEHLVL